MKDIIWPYIIDPSLLQPIGNSGCRVGLTESEFSTLLLEERMRALGLHLLKGQLRYCVLEGSRSNPSLVQKGRVVTIDPSDVPVLMDWYDSQFRQLINTFKPDKLAYRLSLNPNKDQLLCSEFPLGVLNLIAHQQALPIAHYTPQSFVASRLDLAKTADIYKHCDSVLGVHPPYWDTNQKNSALVAWFEL